MTANLLTPSDLILVAILPSPRDLEIARLLGWYRVPLRRAPKVVAVDYLAFYQPGSFGDHKWQIEYVAPVRGQELVTRYELLRDEPDHPSASEEYYKIQLGPLSALEHPVRAERWKRITFFYTTGEYLLRAKTINDLVVHTNERKLLWNALRERASQKQKYEIIEVDLSVDLLAKLLGIRELREEYWDKAAKGAGSTIESDGEDG